VAAGREAVAKGADLWSAPLWVDRIKLAL
jgi:hypothetical protein